MASTDALTGVGNQRAWWDRIAEEEAHRARTVRPSVVAVIDLDDLKEMNDQRGHLHGDLLLRLAAQTLRRTVRPFDIVARVGGDEFAVMAVDYEGDPHVFGERLARALEAADIHASIGVAMPDPTMSLTDAFAHADQAMYANKRRRHHERAGARPVATGPD
jgi:diguanylate cyclase (GGDEF)-like protein